MERWDVRLFIKKFNIACDKDMHEIDLSACPIPAIMAGGLGGVGHSQYYVQEEVTQNQMANTQKPPYVVPSMKEIQAIPWNGLKVASTFSGAGGSCTGYRMAGYRVVWANEFVPAAQASYKANASQHCFLDCRDIRQVAAEEILEQTGLKPGELDLFDGSPPCQAFSTAGKREKGWGKKKQYEHGASQCNEQLFTEYIRLLKGLQPKTFVAENVSGLVKGTAKGFFIEILKELKACGFRVACKVLDAQWLGVPQTRARAIFVGVRNDLKTDPVFPKPFAYRYSVRDALPLMQSIGVRQFDNSAKEMIDSPMSTIACTASRTGLDRKEASVIRQDTSGQWPIKDFGDEPGPAITASNAYHLKMVTGSFQDFHDKKDVTDKPSPALLTSQGNHLIEGDGSDAKNRDDKGRERRRLTIAEVKQLCSFPADFVLKGTYSQQWERLGNSVPPLMMRAISSEIRDKILLP